MACVCARALGVKGMEERGSRHERDSGTETKME